MKHAPNLERFALALDLRGNAKHLCLDRKRPLRPTPLTDETRAFLARHLIPKPLVAFFEEHSYADMVTFGQNRFDPVNELQRAHSTAGEVWFVEEGRLLAVGAGPGGDPIVIDLEGDGTVGFFEQPELYWDPDFLGDPDDPRARQERGSARDLSVATPFDLGSFFLADALVGYDAGRDGDTSYSETHRCFPYDQEAVRDDDKQGWAIFEEAMVAWEKGRQRIPGVGYPLSLKR